MDDLVYRIAAPVLLAASIVISPSVMAQGSFDGHNVNVKFEIWNSGDVSSVKGVTNEKVVFASDATDPDEQDFYVFTEGVDTFDWDIDFDQQTIKLTYTSIEVQDFDHQYMYEYSTGFHFQDSDGSLPDIVNVTVDTSYAPFGLDPELITFDKDNIFVNLNGSMCHIAGMGSMPNCANPDSPTGYDNEIKLNVEFADVDMIDHARTDALFDALETQYSELFPSHQESFSLQGYYVRYYSETELYMGTLNGLLYGYGEMFGGLLEAGTLDDWYEELNILETNSSCAEGQHMMPDGMCMDNSAM